MGLFWDPDSPKYQQHYFDNSVYMCFRDKAFEQRMNSLLESYIPEAKKIGATFITINVLHSYLFQKDNWDGSEVPHEVIFSKSEYINGQRMTSSNICLLKKLYGPDSKTDLDYNNQYNYRLSINEEWAKEIDVTDIAESIKVYKDNLSKLEKQFSLNKELISQFLKNKRQRESSYYCLTTKGGILVKKCSGYDEYYLSRLFLNGRIIWTGKTEKFKGGVVFWKPGYHLEIVGKS